MELNKNNIFNFILKQEIFFKEYETTSNVNPAEHIINLSDIWQGFMSDLTLKSRKNIVDLSPRDICCLIIPFYIGKWHILVRDETYDMHLKPCITFLTAFLNYMIEIGVTKDDKIPEINIERDYILECLIKEADERYNHSYMLLLSSINEAVSIKRFAEDELNECLQDEERAKSVTDVSIEEHAKMVYSYLEPYPMINNVNDNLDIEDVWRPELDTIEVNMLTEKEAEDIARIASMKIIAEELGGEFDPGTMSDHLNKAEEVNLFGIDEIF